MRGERRRERVCVVEESVDNTTVSKAPVLFHKPLGTQQGDGHHFLSFLPFIVVRCNDQWSMHVIDRQLGSCCSCVAGSTGYMPEISTEQVLIQYIQQTWVPAFELRFCWYSPEQWMCFRHRIFCASEQAFPEFLEISSRITNLAGTGPLQFCLTKQFFFGWLLVRIVK